MLEARSQTDTLLALEAEHCARNYHPLGVVIERGEGVWVHDVEGGRYFDALAAYSALNFGHRHPRLIAAAIAQLGKLTLTSRAFHNDQLGHFCEELAAYCGKQMVLPMNTGAEGVESAIKVARKWGYERKGVARDRAKIVVCDQNFHGRTTTIVSFSSDPLAREGFGPYAPGFAAVPYGDADALQAAIDDDTVAFLVEPVQGEAGVIIPPAGYLRRIREICSEANVLLVADEVQTGLGRTGRRFAFDHSDVSPDVYILGKALGGGIVPVSAVVADEDVLGVLGPGEHGSTFGGNPVACAVGREVVRAARRRAHGRRCGRARPRGRAETERRLVSGRHRGPPDRPLDRARDRTRIRDRARGVRAAARMRRVVQGHARSDRADRTPSDRRAGRAQLGARAGRVGARGAPRAVTANSPPRVHQP